MPVSCQPATAGIASICSLLGVGAGVLATMAIGPSLVSASEGPWTLTPWLTLLAGATVTVLLSTAAGWVLSPVTHTQVTPRSARQLTSADLVEPTPDAVTVQSNVTPGRG